MRLYRGLRGRKCTKTREDSRFYPSTSQAPATFPTGGTWETIEEGKLSRKAFSVAVAGLSSFPLVARIRIIDPTATREILILTVERTDVGKRASERGGFLVRHQQLGTQKKVERVYSRYNRTHTVAYEIVVAPYTAAVQQHL